MVPVRPESGQSPADSGRLWQTLADSPLDSAGLCQTLAGLCGPVKIIASLMKNFIALDKKCLFVCTFSITGVSTVDKN